MLLNNNLKAALVIEVLHLLPAFTVLLEILTFGIERLEGLGHVLPNLLSTGWLRCVFALHECLSLKTNKDFASLAVQEHPWYKCLRTAWF